MTQAFAGVRIVDFTQLLAGPFAVMQLALLGAEVIKVEQPGTGDQTRGLMNDDKNDGLSPAFMTCNVNKKSLTLDLKAPATRSVVERLVESADVVVENFRAGTMDRLGFGYDALSKLKPDLIYCSVSGYGQRGPKAGLAAYDGAIQAASGMMSQTGHPATGPAHRLHAGGHVHGAEHRVRHRRRLVPKARHRRGPSTSPCSTPPSSPRRRSSAAT